ncbi:MULTISPECIES: hypothetical protein [unclassified Sphingomonas]|uniref:hypothetical protein n=1 Tax=unclassified Sphingomonas TaxID=196159 RepID=UPI000E74B441|nr:MULTISPECIES: hypothetical protein [unclassified Sphingomonas]RKE50024.1 hypothetical protein C8J39_1584 [Sphingomonas sp. PP-CC-1A-547]TCM08356.1 hypothetical protein C8J41_102322 [Sphingomonas sp. PP-CC-3G-468]
MLSADLRQTLVMTADALEGAQDPWWVISSAAVALHGVAPIEVGDVDVLMSVADAQQAVDQLGVVPIEDGASALFRSTLFARWEMPPLVVEIMAGFHVATGSGWTKVLPRTRVPIFVDERVVYVPDRAELAEMLRLFGRPKDLERVRLLTSPV